MLSAYELNGQKDTVLITKAKQLGDKLAYAWVGVRAALLVLVRLTRLLRATTFRTVR